MTLKQSLVSLEKIRSRNKFLYDINRDERDREVYKAIEKVFKSLEWFANKYIIAIKLNTAHKKEIKRLEKRIVELKNLLAIAENRNQKVAGRKEEAA